MQRERRLLPSISALTAFESVERLASFTAAAEELSLTQSAVSRQVKGLEAQLGVTLLQRNSKTVRATAAGAAYASEIRGALNALRDATIRAVSGGQDSELRLAILPTFGTNWLMPRIPDFVARHPDITLSFTSNIHPFDFETRALDAAIYHGFPNWPGTDAVPLADEWLVPVAAPALIGAAPPARAEALQMLPRLRLLSRRRDWQKWFAAQGIDDTATGGMVFEQFSVLIQACVAGIGVALLPDFLVQSELARGELTAIGPRYQNDERYYFAQPKRSPRHRATDVFRDWLKTQTPPLPV
ncbi:MAG: LysR substrate-binding domain-containing protein [Silicimonas sp.]|nr:LysR substrate-binding domain-containing protein [Silicimonas sp.]